MRKPIIAGNWKMNKTITESLELVRALKLQLKDCPGVEVVIFPPFTALAAVAQELNGAACPRLGAQTMCWEEKGAFTGEISAAMLNDVRCAFVILGHSERRTIFKETNEQVNKKVKAAIKAALTPIVCVGERLEQRKAGQTFAVIEEQLSGSLAGLSADDITRLLIAYEPVWAIGTGQTASPEQAQEVHAFIRQWVGKHFGADSSQRIRIQYGGSVTPENSASLLSQPDIDGALVGGASLLPESFLGIIRAAR